MSGTIAYDTARPKDQNEPPNRVGRAYSRGLRDGAARVLKEWRRGFSHQEVDDWFHGPLQDWVENGRIHDPVPLIAERPNNAR